MEILERPEHYQQAVWESLHRILANSPILEHVPIVEVKQVDDGRHFVNYMDLSIATERPVNFVMMCLVDRMANRIECEIWSALLKHGQRVRSVTFRDASKMSEATDLSPKIAASFVNRKTRNKLKDPTGHTVYDQAWRDDNGYHEFIPDGKIVVIGQKPDTDDKPVAEYQMAYSAWVENNQLHMKHDGKVVVNHPELINVDEC